MGRNIRAFKLHPVTVIHLFGPVGRRFANEVGPERSALHVLRYLKRSVIKKGFGEIDVYNNVIVCCAGLDLFRISYQERHFEGFLENPAFVVEIVFAEEHALIGSIDNDSVFGKAFFVEVVEDAAYVFVNCSDNAEVVLKVFLIGVLYLFLICHLSCIHPAGRPLSIRLVIIHPVR